MKVVIGLIFSKLRLGFVSPTRGASLQLGVRKNMVCLHSKSSQLLFSSWFGLHENMLTFSFVFLLAEHLMKQVRGVAQVVKHGVQDA